MREWQNKKNGSLSYPFSIASPIVKGWAEIGQYWKQLESNLYYFKSIDCQIRWTLGEQWLDIKN